MKRKLTQGRAFSLISNLSIGNLIIAAIIYTGFSIFLYYPYFHRFSILQWVLPLNSVISAVGCYLLSRRWISSPAGSFLAGGIYGFSPYILSFGLFHPLSGIPAVLVPWLFIPATYYRIIFRKSILQRSIVILLASLPFLFIIVFFVLIKQFSFLLPVQRITPGDMVIFAFPLTFKAQGIMISIYHIPIITLIIGLIMYIMVHRISVLIIVLLSLVLSLGRITFGISPVVWASIPLLYAAILAGVGSQGLVWSGKSDSKWLAVSLLSAIGLGCLAYFSGMNKNTPIYTETVKMYALAAIMSASILFFAKSNHRWHLTRWGLVFGALCLDITLTAQYLIDKIL